jgi:hypothetical protein
MDSKRISNHFCRFIDAFGTPGAVTLLASIKDSNRTETYGAIEKNS